MKILEEQQQRRRRKLAALRASSERPTAQRPPATLPPSVVLNRGKEARKELRAATIASAVANPRSEQRTQAKLRSFELAKHRFELAKFCETRSAAGRLDLLPEELKSALATCFQSLPK